MEYQQIRKNQYQFIILASLTVAEFDALLLIYERHWLKYHLYYTLEGKVAQTS